jgi:hypothetical protein
MAKTEFLQIRLSPTDRERIVRAATTDHLDASTWARRVLLKALEEWEQQQTPRQTLGLDQEAEVIEPGRGRFPEPG